MRVLFFEDGKSQPMMTIQVADVGELADRLQAILQPAKPAYDPREVAFRNDEPCYTIGQAAAIVGKNPRRLQIKAKRQGHPGRKRQRLGGGWEYPISWFPESWQVVLRDCT